jgi:flagellar basal-body rod protein FlgC
MAIFGAIQTSGTGLQVHRKWLDAVADNVANLNTVRSTDQPAFQARFLVAQARGDGGGTPGVGSGVRATGVVFGDPAGRLVHEPTHPLADAEGMVRYPDVDLGSQMVQMMVAQRGYQANLGVIDRARDSYLAALQLGRA